MIVTITLNPSLDRAIEVEELVRGEVIRATSARLDLKHSQWESSIP